MNFVEITDTKGNRIAINPAHIIHMNTDNRGILTITLVTDRRIQTGMFRNIAEAAKYCMTTTIDTTKVGAPL